MLRKLIKYDFIDFTRRMLPMYAAVFVLFIIAAIFMPTNPKMMEKGFTGIAGFIFIPIVLRGVYLLFEGKTEKSYIYVFGTIGLVLSHNISTMLTFLIGLFYVLVNIKKLKDKKILKNFVISFQKES